MPKTLPDASWYKKGTKRSYVTVRAMSCHLMWETSPFILNIPAGREFESSVPRVFQGIWSPSDPYYMRAALFHDVLIEQGSRRFDADCQWRATALQDGAPPFRTGVAFAGMFTRRFGDWTINGNRRP